MIRTATVTIVLALFVAGFAGFLANDARGWLAMHELLRSPGADHAFKRLIAHGTTVGQLYGLIGVSRTE